MLSLSGSKTVSRKMFKGADAFPQKDLNELDRRMKLLEGTKPWTLANRIKMIISRDDPQSVRTHSEILDLVAMTTRGLSFFIHQSLSNCVKLVRNMHSRSFKKGEVIFEQGDKGEDLFVVLDGSVDFRRSFADGGEARTVGQANRGAEFGEKALLKNSPREFTAVALTAVDCLLIDKTTFLLTCGEDDVSKKRDCANLLKEDTQCFKRFTIQDVTAVAEMMAVGHYEDDHVWILDNSHSLHFIKEGVCTLYDPCQAPPLQRKEKAKGRYAAVKEEAAPPADVEGGGSKYTGAGAVKLATLTRGKFFGESCAFPEKRLGWVVVAEGDVTLCSMQKDTFLTSVPRDMFLAIRAESTFCHDFYQGAFNSTTSKAKARSLKEQQDALAAEREKEMQRKEQEISLENIFSSRRKAAVYNVQGVEATSELNDMIVVVNDLGNKARNMTIKPKSSVENFDSVPVRGFLEEANWITKMQEELQVKNFQKVDESKRKVTAVSKPPPESGKLAEFKERRRQSMSYKEEQGGRAFDPAQALASRLSYHTRAHHEPRASQVHHSTTTFKPKVSFSVHRPGPSVTIDDGIPPTSNFCKLKLQSVKSLPSPAAEGLGQSPSSEWTSAYSPTAGHLADLDFRRAPSTASSVVLFHTKRPPDFHLRVLGASGDDLASQSRSASAGSPSPSRRHRSPKKHFRGASQSVDAVGDDACGTSSPNPRGRSKLASCVTERVMGKAVSVHDFNDPDAIPKLFQASPKKKRMLKQMSGAGTDWFMELKSRLVSNEDPARLNTA